MAELEKRAPVLHKLLSACVDARRRKRPFKSTYRSSNAAAIGISAAILLRHRNQHMNALQHIISLILHCGHAGKQVKTAWKILCMSGYSLSNPHSQVYRRLQKLLFCLSHPRTNAFLDVLGKEYDDWKQVLKTSLVCLLTTMCCVNPPFAVLWREWSRD